MVAVVSASVIGTSVYVPFQLAGKASVNGGGEPGCAPAGIALAALVGTMLAAAINADVALGTLVIGVVVMPCVPP